MTFFTKPLFSLREPKGFVEHHLLHWFWFLGTRTVYNVIVEEHSSGATMEKEVGDETRLI